MFRRKHPPPTTRGVCFLFVSSMYLWLKWNRCEYTGTRYVHTYTSYKPVFYTCFCLYSKKSRIKSTVLWYVPEASQQLYIRRSSDVSPPSSDRPGSTRTTAVKYHLMANGRIPKWSTTTQNSWIERNMISYVCTCAIYSFPFTDTTGPRMINNSQRKSAWKFGKK